MEAIVLVATLAAAWGMAFLNLRQVRRLLAEMKVLLDAHLRRLERMQNAMAHGVARVHRSLERMRRDAAQGAGVAVLGPRPSTEPRRAARACHQHASGILMATSRSRRYRRRPSRNP